MKKNETIFNGKKKEGRGTINYEPTILKK